MPLASSGEQAKRKQRIGLFGGTFDPIHMGHLVLVEEARCQLHLDSVYLVPTGAPPHKQERRITPVDQRIKMLKLATADNEHLKISRVDVNRPGPHYSVDTVLLLQETLPLDAQLFFLVGMDSLRDFHTWYQPDKLASLCQLVSFNRPHIKLDWSLLERSIPGIRERVTILKMPLLEISSSDLRQRVQHGRSIRYLLPQAVESFIQEESLYASNAEETSSIQSER